MVVVVARASGEGPPPAPVEARHQHKNMYCLLACLLFADAAVKEEIHRKMAYWPAAKQARLPRFFFFSFFLALSIPFAFFLLHHACFWCRQLGEAWKGEDTGFLVSACFAQSIRFAFLHVSCQQRLTI